MTTQVSYQTTTVDHAQELQNMTKCTTDQEQLTRALVLVTAVPAVVGVITHPRLVDAVTVVTQKRSVLHVAFVSRCI